MTKEQKALVTEKIDFYRNDPRVWLWVAGADYDDFVVGGTGSLSEEEKAQYYPGWTVEMFGHVRFMMDGMTNRR